MVCDSHLLQPSNKETATAPPFQGSLFSKLSEDSSMCFEMLSNHNCAIRISDTSFTMERTSIQLRAFKEK